MKKLLSILFLISFLFILTSASCDDGRPDNVSAKDEQAHTEINQENLNKQQPPPNVTWSLERDNLIKRFKLQNDRSVTFFMYVFIEGVSNPIGYYEVTKVSSVNSQLTNTQQLVETSDHGGYTHLAMPSPAEDGSYGTNGEGVFGFTPEDIYIESNMHYIVSSVPLNFPSAPKLAIVNTDQIRQLLEVSKQAMK